MNDLIAAIAIIEHLQVTSQRLHNHFCVAKDVHRDMEQPVPIRLLDYYYKLEAKVKVRYLENLSYILNEYPYILKNNFFKDVSHLPALR